MSPRNNIRELVDEARQWPRDGINEGALINALADEVELLNRDWRVLGGVVPGPIPVEWVQAGDTIQDHGVTGTITRAVRTGGMVHLVIGSGHVSFAKVAQQDFVTVLSSNHTDGGL